MQTDYIKVTPTNKKIAEQLLNSSDSVTHTSKLRVKSYEHVLNVMMEQMQGSWMMHLEMYRSGLFRPQLMRTKEAAVEHFVQETKAHMRRAIEEQLMDGKQATLVYLPIPMSIWKIKPDDVCAAIIQSVENGTQFFNWIMDVCESFADYYVVPEVRAFIDDDDTKSFVMPIFGFICRRKIST